MPITSGDHSPCRNHSPAGARKLIMTSKFLTQPENYEPGALYLLIRGYDETTDEFDLCEYVFQDEHPLVVQTSDSDWVDVDDMKIPGTVLPFLCGEYGEPHELVGRVFKLAAPK